MDCRTIMASEARIDDRSAWWLSIGFQTRWATDISVKGKDTSGGFFGVVPLEGDPERTQGVGGDEMDEPLTLKDGIDQVSAHHLVRPDLDWREYVRLDFEGE